MDESVDVVVVGAGPVGLLAAIELTLGGAHVVVLERLGAASTAMKAGGIGPLGIEALQRRGMAAAIAAEEARNVAAMAPFIEQAGAAKRGPNSKFSGHFAGLPLIRREAQREPERRARMVDQQGVEAMLGDRARALGIEVRRGCELTGLAQLADGVDAVWESQTGAGRIRCGWLVGCDGGRSLVRKLSGFDFPGTPPSSTFYQAVGEIDHPARLLPIGWHRTAGGVFSCGPLPGRLVMLDFNGPPEDREAPVTREELEGVLRRISGVDVRVKALASASRWTDNTRLVDSYRRGRVLLAGDAAHIHTPFGGQGLGLGLVDAANLGWKLAAVVRGEMPDSLLDSYTAERRPVAEAVLANTLAQVAIMRPDPQAGAMRDLFAELMQLDDVNRFIGEMTSGLFTRYALGSPRDEVGRLIGDRPLRRGDGEVSSLYELMQDGSGVLLDASTDGKASELVGGATQRIRCVAVDTGPSMLVRPDACIAWVGDGDGTEGIEEALRRWCPGPHHQPPSPSTFFL
jgi:2-polyprenyl-6-methoxyphenol hydroxylase-like FAD-dependent oxidoreductase